MDVIYQCTFCKSNVQNVKEKYAGKLVHSVILYDENGKSHMLLPIFEHHFEHQCSEITTGKFTNPICKVLFADFCN